MIQTIRKAWGIPELRKKIMFTLMILVIYRLGSAIPVPYVDTNTLSTYLNGMGTTILGLYNVMSGGAFAQATVFALGIQPYINSSIIIQLLPVAIPVALVIMISWVAGSSFLMWLGEQCNEFGVGNGISMILFAGIISRIPSMISTLYSAILTGTMHWAWTLLIVVGVLLLVVLIVFVNDAERRIPVQYAKRQVGRKMYGGQSSSLPMKVNMSGVLPVIFAQSIASIPATIGAFLPAPNEGTFAYSLLNAIDTKSFLYLVVYFLLIIGFSYFYATIQFNPVEISNNLKRNGGFIPGFRPGRPTSDFIARVLNKITLFGAIYLGVVAILPLLADKFSAVAIGIGGTSIIIVVGVALETVQALENQMLMRQYKGFLE